MSSTAHANVATDKPVPYMRQLCKHFGHRLETDFGDDSGWIDFSDGRCDLSTGEGVLELLITADTEESRDRLQGVVGSHLERFGRRDELSVTWH